MFYQWWFWAVIGYVLGSIPFGLLIGLTRGVDVRKQGSGNVGATNVGRVLGRKWGAFCFILDVLKGAVPVAVAGIVLGYVCRFDLPAQQAWQWLAVGAAAVLGHVFPVWLGFRGGKGVATALGVLLGFYPILTLPGLAAALTWLLLAGMFRYVSLASLFAAVCVPMYLLVEAACTGRSVQEIYPFLIVSGLLAVLVIVRHRSNIQRLAAGTESRLGGGGSKKSEVRSQK